MNELGLIGTHELYHKINVFMVLLFYLTEHNPADFPPIIVSDCLNRPGDLNV